MTAAKTEPKGLHAKLAEVMAEAGRIPKNGTYSGQGSFKYVLVGDAADAIRKALGERGVSMLPTAVDVVSEAEHETRSGGTMTTITIRTTWTLTDGETGQTAVIQSIGTGADAGDKASPKAQTNAMKYAVLMGFLLSTGDDPEQSDSSDRLRPANAANERPELLGNIAKSGKVAKGTAEGYKLEWREGPDGHAIGFRVDIEGQDERSIPQVLVKGTIGEALYLATGGDPKALLGKRISFKGKLYGIHQPPPRQTYFRLIIGEYPDSDFIETPDVRIPALDVAPAPTTATETPEEQPEAASVPLFELDPDERLLVGQGLPE